MKIKLEQVVDATERDEEEDNKKRKEVAEEDVVPEPDTILNEEPFLKAIKSIGGKIWKLYHFSMERWILI